MMDYLTYSLTCNCGVTITAANEKGLRKLVVRHVNEGQVHACWKAYYNNDEVIELKKILDLGKIFDEPRGSE